MDLSFRSLEARKLLRGSQIISHRKLQSLVASGGNSGTLFSAFMLVIVIVCLVTYCYRKSLYNLHNRGAADVEVIIEANAQASETDSNLAQVGEYHTESGGIIINPDLDSASEKIRKKDLQVQRLSYKANNHMIDDSVNAHIAVAYEYNLSHATAGVTQARPVRVMESFSSSSGLLVNDGNGESSPSNSFNESHPSIYDHDYLIETERNMFEFNSDFIRVSSANAAAADVDESKHGIEGTDNTFDTSQVPIRDQGDSASISSSSSPINIATGTGTGTRTGFAGSNVYPVQRIGVNGQTRRNTSPRNDECANQ